MRSFTFSPGEPGESLVVKQVTMVELGVFYIYVAILLYLGVTYDISNKHRLGYSEVELVQKMIDGVNTLVQEDRDLAKKHSL